MQTLLQEFERHLIGSDADEYVVLLYGRDRPGDTWQGWLVFVRQRDNRRFATPVESTQPNAEAIIYWSSGLTNTYLDGALRRAMDPSAVIPQPPAPMSNIEQGILAIFQRLRQPRVLVQRLFDELPFSREEIVNAIEDLQGQQRLVVRSTEDGNDWLSLTVEGMIAARANDLREARNLV
jgi:hypothetical protein